MGGPTHSVSPTVLGDIISSFVHPVGYAPVNGPFLLVPANGSVTNDPIALPDGMGTVLPDAN